MQIKESYVVVFEDATTLQKEPYQDWRSEKYIGKEGLLLVIADNDSQHIQWHPLEEGRILLTKGIVSSNDDVTKSGNSIVVKTENSYYYFLIIKKEINGTDRIKLW